MLGLAAFRWLLRIGPPGIRLVIAGLALPTAIIGLTVSPEAQLALLVPILAVGAAADSRWASH